MTSTYSPNLAIELIGTGDQLNVWGTTTNNNLGSLIEQAISGYYVLNMANADQTITIPNGATGIARNMYIELTSTLTSTRTLTVPTNQKLYFIYNNTSGGQAVIVKTAAGAGVTVRAGQKLALVCNGTDVLSAINGVGAPESIIHSGSDPTLQVTQQGTGLALSVSGPSVVSASSTTEALRVTQTGSGNAILVEDDTNPDATPFVVTANGNVIIGDTATETNPSGFPAVFQVNAFIAQQLNYAAANTAGPVQYFQKARLSGSTPIVVNTGDVLGATIFTGYDGANYCNSASIYATCTGSPATNSVSGALGLAVTPVGSSTYTAQMVINGYGINVGSTEAFSSEAITFNIGKDLGGQTTAFSIAVRNTIQSSVTANAISFASRPSTAATAFTLSNIFHFSAIDTVLGVGSTITYQAAYYVGALTNATFNEGFVSLIDLGAGNNYGFKSAGTANNLFRGNTRIGSSSAPVATLDVTGNIAATTTILTTGQTSGIGYGAGAGNAVNQTGTRTTTVDCNSICGRITLVSATATAGTSTSFQVNNSTVAATDVIIVNLRSGATADKYNVSVVAVSAGSFRIQLHCFSTVSVAESPIVSFAVIKAVAS